MKIKPSPTQIATMSGLVLGLLMMALLAWLPQINQTHGSFLYQFKGFFWDGVAYGVGGGLGALGAVGLMSRWNSNRDQRARNRKGRSC